MECLRRAVCRFLSGEKFYKGCETALAHGSGLYCSLYMLTSHNTFFTSCAVAQDIQSLTSHPT